MDSTLDSILADLTKSLDSLRSSESAKMSYFSLTRSLTGVAVQARFLNSPDSTAFTDIAVSICTLPLNTQEIFPPSSGTSEATPLSFETTPSEPLSVWRRSYVWVMTKLAALLYSRT